MHPATELARATARKMIEDAANALGFYAALPGTTTVQESIDFTLTLAREALAMRERGVEGWLVLAPGEHVAEALRWDEPCLSLEHARELAAEADLGVRIIPLYAGEPVEVDDA